MTKILVCDDEKDIVSALNIYLSAEGYEVLEACDGAEALEILEKEDVKLVLLDVMMPKMDGITALSRLREKSRVPVILLTAKSEDSDKIMGLNIGADDYITKPFNPVEVAARVKSQLRRYLQFGSSPEEGEGEGKYRLGGMELDDRTKEFFLYGEKVPLTPTEFDIMKLLIRRPGAVLSPKEIYRRVWNEAPYGAESTVAVHIRHIREKIEVDPADPRFLKVVWAQGYKLEAGDQ